MVTSENVKEILDLVKRDGDEHRLGRCSFRANDMIGTSCFTTVFSCRSRYFSDPAIKILNPVVVPKVEVSSRVIQLWRRLCEPQLALSQKAVESDLTLLLPTVIEHDKGRSNLWYIVLPRALGVPASDLEHRGIKLPSERLPGLALKIARGVNFFHAQRIAHDSLTPTNVFFDPRRSMHVTLLEPGIPRVFGYDAGLFSPGEWERWSPYLSPEAQRSVNYDEFVADVFSLGALFYWLVVHRAPPVLTPNPDQNVMAESLVEQSLNRQRSTLNPAFLDLIRRCMSAEPQKRPTMSELLERLEASSDAAIGSRTQVTPSNGVNTTAVDKPANAAGTVRMQIDEAIGVKIATAALGLAVLGERERAKSHLEDYLRMVSIAPRDLLTQPAFKSLSTDAEFIALLDSLAHPSS